MKRRPFLTLSLAMAVAAIVQAMLSAASPTVAESRGQLPPGMVCTACGPIPTSFRGLDAPLVTLPDAEGSTDRVWSATGVGTQLSDTPRQ
jgi:hypothetical protein